jgi:hypothetical protein
MNTDKRDYGKSQFWPIDQLLHLGFRLYAWRQTLHKANATRERRNSRENTSLSLSIDSSIVYTLKSKCQLPECAAEAVRRNLRVNAELANNEMTAQGEQTI